MANKEKIIQAGYATYTDIFVKIMQAGYYFSCFTMTCVFDLLELSDIAVNELLVETMVSFDPELRFLALEGRVVKVFIILYLFAFYHFNLLLLHVAFK